MRVRFYRKDIENELTFAAQGKSITISFPSLSLSLCSNAMHSHRPAHAGIFDFVFVVRFYPLSMTMTGRHEQVNIHWSFNICRMTK